MDIRQIIGSPDFSSPNPSSLDSFRILLLGKAHANGLGALANARYVRVLILNMLKLSGSLEMQRFGFCLLNFLSSTLHCQARKKKFPIDTLIWTFHFLKKEIASHPKPEEQ